MATINVDLNITLEIDDDTWYEALEVNEGVEDDALYEVMNDLESEYGESIYGSWWACSAKATGFIDRPGKDTRPK